MKYVFLCTALLTCAMPTLSKAYVEEPDVREVSPKLRSGQPVWAYGGVSLEILVDCRIEYGLLSWPRSASCHKPEMMVDLPQSSFDTHNLYIGNVALSQYNYSSYERLKEALSQLLLIDLPLIELSFGSFDSPGGSYTEEITLLSLTDFASTVRTYKARAHQKVAERLKIEREAYKRKAMGLIVALAIGGLTLWVMCRAIWMRVLPILGRSSLNLARSARREWNNWRIRRVTMHESVREAVNHSTRAQLEKADESDASIIRHQVHSALEKGDNELAQTLLTALRRTEDSER